MFAQQLKESFAELLNADTITTADINLSSAKTVIDTLDTADVNPANVDTQSNIDNSLNSDEQKANETIQKDTDLENDVSENVSESLDGTSQGESCNPSENESHETKSIKHPNITYEIESYARLVEGCQIEPSIFMTPQDNIYKNSVNKIQQQISESSVNEIQDKISESSVNEIQDKFSELSLNEIQDNIFEPYINEIQGKISEPQDDCLLPPKAKCESEIGEVDIESTANFLIKLKEIEEKVSVGKGKEIITESETTYDFLDDEIVNLDEDQNKFDDNIEKQKFDNDITINDFQQVVETNHKELPQGFQQMKDKVSNDNYDDDDDIEEIPRDDEFYHPSPKIIEFLGVDIETENMNDLDLDPVKAWERIQSFKNFTSAEVLNKPSKKDFKGKKNFLTHIVRTESNKNCSFSPRRSIYEHQKIGCSLLNGKSS